MSATTVLTLITGGLFLVTGGVKVLGVPQSLAIRDHFGMSPNLWRTVGVLESAGAVGVLVGIAFTPLAVLALVGLALLMCGAIASRLRVHDPVLMLLGDAAALGLVVTTTVAVVAA
jgi:uncharacterized membrane protein YphA (DoxX/SURF4 family)